ncbi:MAG: RidA family protein [Cytophagaceae bacterium]|nr:RidA family protein [Cytophagaceae bacterium]MDW8456797.1 RidA family protein [Cytophagaceae bacterium]
MKEIINTANAPQPIGPYSQAIMANDILFISGQIAIDPKTGNLLNQNIEEETTQVMNNIKAILEEANMTFSHVVKSTIFVKDLNHFAAINHIYAQYFPVEPPARETVEVARLPKDANVEISCIAVRL